MRRIYLDNAATAFPKAPGTAEAIYEHIRSNVVNLYRTESAESESVFSSVFGLREMIASLYGYAHPECVAFTLNATEAINMAIKGLIRPGASVITTSNEHNAVMRPLSQLGCHVIRIPSDTKGRSLWDGFLPEKADAMVINAAGNVSGAVEDLERAAEEARRLSIPLLIDASQASPYVDIDMSDLDAAAVCFPGHKGFLGPEGTGGAIFRRDIAESIEPLITGGTGTESDSEIVPHTLPERLSGGTENIPGLVGLSTSLGYVIENLGDIRRHSLAMTERLIDGLKGIDGITMHGPDADEPRTPIVSVSAEKDIAWLASVLLERSGIETRVGLHCSPSSHRSLGTFPSGTLRFSPGPFTTADEIDETIRTLKEAMDE